MEFGSLDGILAILNACFFKNANTAPHPNIYRQCMPSSGFMVTTAPMGATVPISGPGI